MQRSLFQRNPSMKLSEAAFAIGYGRGLTGGGGGGAWIKCPQNGADRTCDYLATLFPIAMILIFIPTTGLIIWLETTGRIDEAKKLAGKTTIQKGAKKKARQTKK